MKYNQLDKELGKSKFFIVRYAGLINMSILIFLTLVLYELKIDEKSILELLINYYFH
jgi:hypothetical protein